MDFRRVLVLGLASAGAILAFGSSSCTIVDPQEVDFEAKPVTSAIGDDTGPGSTSGGEGGSTEGGGEAGEGGEASGPITAFSGAPAYDGTTAGMTTGSNNNNPSHASFNATTFNPAGQECLTCHKAGSAVGATEFAFGTTIYQQAAGTAALTTHAEVRIVDAKGVLVAQAYSDELGNVWTDPITGGIPAGSHVGVRNGTIMKLMSTTLGGPSDGDCTKSTCHGTGGAAGGKVFLQ